MQMEVHVDNDLHRNSMSLVNGRLEPVLLHCFDGLFFQSHAKMTSQADVLGDPLRIDNELDGNAALIIRSPSIVCELWLNRVDYLGRADAIPHTHQASAVATTGARTGSGAASRANPAAEALTES